MAGAPARIGSSSQRVLGDHGERRRGAAGARGQTALDQRLVAEPEGQRQQADRGHVFAVPGTIVELLAEPACIVEPAGAAEHHRLDPDEDGRPRPRQHLLAQGDRLAVPAGHRQRHQLRPMSAERVGLQLYGARGVPRRRLGVAQRAGRRGRQEVHLRRERITGEGPIEAHAGVGVTIGGGQEHAVGRLADGVVLVEGQRRRERLLGRPPMRLEVEGVDALGAMRRRQLRVERQGARHRIERLGLRLRRRHPAIDVQDRVAIGEATVGRSVAVVEGNRTFEAGDCRANHRGRTLVPQVPALEVEVVGERVSGGPRHRAAAAQRRRHGGDDRLHHVVLHLEDVGELAIVAIGPDVVPALDGGQVHGEPQLRPGAPHAALEDCIDAELAPDLPDVEVAAAIAERRGARGDAQPGQPGERVDQVLGQAVAEVLVLDAGAAEIREGQHRHRARHRCARRRPVAVVRDRLEGLSQFARRREAPPGIGRETSPHRRRQCRRDTRPEGQFGRQPVQHQGDGLGWRPAAERASTGQHLVQDRPAREDVGPVIEAAGAGLLG